jgi:hypothetical protein
MVKIVLPLHRRVDFSLDEWRGYWRETFCRAVTARPHCAMGSPTSCSTIWRQMPPTMDSLPGPTFVNLLDPSRFQMLMVVEDEVRVAVDPMA